MFQAVAIKNRCSWYSITCGNSTVAMYDERGRTRYINITEVTPHDRDIVTLFVNGNHFESVVPPKSLQRDDPSDYYPSGDSVDNDLDNSCDGNYDGDGEREVIYQGTATVVSATELL